MLTVFADVTPLAAVFLGVGMAGLVSIPALLFADAHRSDFDPRPAGRRATESGRLDALLTTAANARYDVRELTGGLVLDARLSLRHAAVTAAALLALLLPASPEGARS
ncbi:hypothetical protein IHE56_01135 [Streptomyces sp. ID01-12c]|nr:hypothetical protein [Streptomyces caniscabiei]